MNILSTKHTRLLVFLARYKYLCTEQIYRLIYADKTLRACQQALEYLDRKGYIKRAKLPRSHNLNFGYLSYLTKQGLELVLNEQQADNQTYAKSLVTKPFSSINHYYHRKCLVDFQIKLDQDILHLPTIKLKTVLTEAGQKQVGKKYVTETKLTLGRVSIIPDLIFVLRNVQTDIQRVFMVEIDSGIEAIGGQFDTIPKGSLLYKYRIYEKFLQSNDWQEQIGTNAETFQILTVTERETHLKTLTERIEKNMDYPEYFLGSTLNWCKKGICF
ncbi:MAG: hypothetical protein GKR88_18050 [Flavobacteriaceae bacterium]|nr:MAG: hypothetical protein GKR88_18050 [Flavobacteriaceae bacterium]